MKVSTPLDREGFYIMKHKEEREKEIWKDIEGYEDYCQISSHGRVRTYDRFIESRWGTPFLVKGRIRGFSKRRGYHGVVITKNGIRTTISVHRTVAETFIPNPKNKSQVNHLDGVKTNNYVKNLNWVTNLENMEHAWETGLFDGRDQRGENCYNSKLNEFQVRVIRKCHDLTHEELAKVFNVCRPSITMIKNYTTWKNVK